MDDRSFRFDPNQLKSSRPAGISAFMRIRNGEDFLEPTIESHVNYFDEIVAVHNECTDASVAILEGLRRRFGAKIRIFEYEPRVYRLGSKEHRRASTWSVHSMANYSNFCLAQTRYSVVLKLDDDHVAIPSTVKAITDMIRSQGCRLGRRLLCFSGINVTEHAGKWGSHRIIPFAGDGDHWFYEANPQNYFRQDRRFERFNRGGLRMQYHGISYWHLKYLKKDYGFSNYELDKNPDSRFHKHRGLFEQDRIPLSLDELAQQCRKHAEHPPFRSRVLSIFSAKEHLRQQRNQQFDLLELAVELERLRSRLRALETPRAADGPRHLHAAA